MRSIPGVNLALETLPDIGDVDHDLCVGSDELRCIGMYGSDTRVWMRIPHESGRLTYDRRWSVLEYAATIRRPHRRYLVPVRSNSRTQSPRV